jgi:hypothetical protein
MVNDNGSRHIELFTQGPCVPVAGILHFVILFVYHLYLIPRPHACIFTPTMPARSFKINKRLVTPSIRLYSGSRFGGKDQKVKVVKAAQMSEQRRQLNERRRKKEELRNYFLITRL